MSEYVCVCLYVCVYLCVRSVTKCSMLAVDESVRTRKIHELTFLLLWHRYSQICKNVILFSGDV